MSHEAIIKFAPIFTLDRFSDPKWARPGRTMYEPGAFRFPLGKETFGPDMETIPLLVDHLDEQEIGTVHELWKWDWIDGPWFVARATVTAPPPWLKRGTPSSFGYSSLQTREVEIREHRAEVVGGAFINEVSVLSPAKNPAEPLAQVLSLRPMERKPASSPAVPTSNRAAGETDDYRPPIWDELERVVGYRITDENLERALAQAQQARRSPLEQYYAEVMAARRTEPQVLIRPGVGQVLAVGGVPAR